MTMRVRLAVAVGAVAAVAIAAASITAYVLTEDGLVDEVDASLEARALSVAAQVDRRGPGQGTRFRGPVEIQVGPDEVIWVIDDQGRTVDQTRPVALELGVEDIAVDGGKRRHGTYTDGESFRWFATPVRGGGAVFVARDLREVDAVLGGLRNQLIAVTAVGSLAAAAVGWLLARRTARPIEHLADAAGHVAATEDLSVPVEVVGSDEVGRLGTSFNAMLTALRTSREQQRRLVEDAGHELRTPLTSLRTNAEVLQRFSDLDPSDRERLLADMVEEVGELTELVNELVTLAAEPDTGRGEPMMFRLDEVVANAADRFGRRSGREVTVATTPWTVTGWPDETDRAIANLLGNADKFSPEGETVEVHQTGSRVAVRDHGPGISPPDRPHVFERFWRGDDARQRPGSGLGLSIVHAVARDHGGSVFVEEPEGGGALVGLVVPGAPPDDAPASEAAPE